MVGQDIYEYAFKRTVRDFDDLVDVAYATGENRESAGRYLKLKALRAELLELRPNSGPAVGFSLAPRRGADSRVEVKDSKNYTEMSDDELITEAAERIGAAAVTHFEKGLANVTPAPSVLDFAGAWLTEGGQRAQVGPRRVDGLWDGFVTGQGAAVWTAEGKNENPKLNLNERVREGAGYR